MTTIAYRDGVLAADTMMSYDSTPITLLDLKLFVAGDYAVGICGDCRFIPTLKRWFIAGCPIDDSDFEKLWDDNYDLIAMDTDGCVFMLLADTLFPLSSSFHSIGSGRLSALGAMAQGATAREAINVAARFDVNTGTVTQAITTEDLKKACAENGK